MILKTTFIKAVMYILLYILLGGKLSNSDLSGSVRLVLEIIVQGTSWAA